MSDLGYVNYFGILGLSESAKPGDVRKVYRRKMKDLVFEIAKAEITEDRRAHFLLDMAKLNAALFVLRDSDVRETYWQERSNLIELEAQWREASSTDGADVDSMRRRHDSALRAFLARYVEEAMLTAGRDKECVEASNWDVAHERHASKILRQYRHRLHQEILERLPYYDITPPKIDWDERSAVISALLTSER